MHLSSVSFNEPKQSITIIIINNSTIKLLLLF